MTSSRFNAHPSCDQSNGSILNSARDYVVHIGYHARYVASSSSCIVPHIFLQPPPQHNTTQHSLYACGGSYILVCFYDDAFHIVRRTRIKQQDASFFIRLVAGGHCCIGEYFTCRQEEKMGWRRNDGSWNLEEILGKSDGGTEEEMSCSGPRGAFFWQERTNINDNYP
jgi:hypothetical protein